MELLIDASSYFMNGPKKCAPPSQVLSMEPEHHNDDHAAAGAFVSSSNSFLPAFSQILTTAHDPGLAWLGWGWLFHNIAVACWKTKKVERACRQRSNTAEATPNKTSVL